MSPVDHRYDVPPVAVSVALPPVQIDVGPLIAALGNGFTVMTIGAEVPLQPLVVSVAETV